MCLARAPPSNLCSLCCTHLCNLLLVELLQRCRKIEVFLGHRHGGRWAGRGQTRLAGRALWHATVAACTCTRAHTAHPCCFKSLGTCMLTLLCTKAAASSTPQRQNRACRVVTTCTQQTAHALPGAWELTVNQAKQVHTKAYKSKHVPPLFAIHYFITAFAQALPHISTSSQHMHACTLLQQASLHMMQPCARCTCSHASHAHWRQHDQHPPEKRPPPLPPAVLPPRGPALG